MFWKKKSHTEVENGLKPVFPKLWRYCVALTGNCELADDLAQAACLRALEKSDQYEPGSHLDRWIFRVAQRIWLNELRASTARQGGGIATLDEIDIPDSQPDPEANFLTRAVLLEILALPEAQRLAVNLVYAEGYSYKEAADILGIPIGTVMSRLAAARIKLAEKFEYKKSDTK